MPSPPPSRRRRGHAALALAAAAAAATVAASVPSASAFGSAGTASLPAAARSSPSRPSLPPPRRFFTVPSLASSSSASAVDEGASSASTIEVTPEETPENAVVGRRKWKPKTRTPEERRKLRGLIHDTERVGTKGFHHVEFYCGDARSTAYRFSLALGMPVTCWSGQGTGNDKCATYGLESGDVRFLFTAPYSEAVVAASSASASASADEEEEEEFEAPDPLPSFDVTSAHDFHRKHGLAARAIGVEVECARAAYEAAVAGGARGGTEPTEVKACRGYAGARGGGKAAGCTVSEVELYGDVVLRFVSFPKGEGEDEDEDEEAGSTATDTAAAASLPFLPNLAPTPNARRDTYGLRRIDHAVGNVPDLYAATRYVSKFTGFHEFAEFTSEDVGTVESGLNSVVLASDSEDVLLPLNEPTEGRRKSQIQTYLEQNEGAGLQHLALKTDDIFETITKMRKAEAELGGFELMVRPSDGYYRELPERLGDQLTPDQYRRLEDLGILADADDEGVLLQIFTKPVGDRPTFFVEIIQRVGCRYEPDDGSGRTLERPGCGGFGQGNFRELFKAIEDHEKTLKV